jgi:hypothetical protein
MGTEDRARAFVPDDFAVPRELVTGDFRLEPLGPQHNAGDYEAWTSSIDHIRATPGFGDGTWPNPEMTLEENLADLRRHAEDFAQLQVSPMPCWPAAATASSAVSTSIRGVARRAQPTSSPGYGPNGPILTPPCTMPWRPGWTTPGHSL